MKRTVCNMLLVAIWCFFTKPALAQFPVNLIDTINKKIELYGIKHSSSVLFSHFDKNIYIANEDVWFTTYLLNYNKQTNNPSILTALLIKNNDSKIIIERHFVMSGGLSFGHLVIPGNTAPGEYCFIVYTNVLKGNRPIDYFRQPVTVKSATRPGFYFTVRDTTNPAGNHGRVLVHVAKRDASPVPHALITVGVDSIVFKGETDRGGNYTAPVSGHDLNKSPVYTEVTYGNETFSERKTLSPKKKTGYSVKFFPEGGSLVYATTSTIGWQVKTADGRPQKAKAVLLRDNNPTDTLATNIYGLGRFILKPILGSKYAIKLIGDQRDTSYKLPDILFSGPVLSINRAVCNDSLRLHIISQNTASFLVFIHDYAHSYFSFPVKAGPAGKDILVNLQTVPKGLCAVTITDRLGRPLAERIFFAHFDKQVACAIQTDSSTYHCRQKVTLKLSFAARNSDVTQGAVSIACVESSRLDPSNSNDISTYTYLSHELATMLVRSGYLNQTADSRAFLENVLLIKGWRRFTWRDMMKAIDKDTSSKPDSIYAFQGRVTRAGGSLKKPVNLLLSADSVTRIVSTDKIGLFRLTGPLITAEEGKKISLRTSLGSDAIISVNNPFANADKYLIDQLHRERNSTDNGSVLTEDSLVLNGFKHVLNLKEVAIRAKPLASGPDSESGRGANGCGDYICNENVLNCPIHASEADKMPAVKGGVYGIMTSHRGDDVLAPLINGNYVKIGSFRNYQNDGYDVVRYLGCPFPENKVDTVAFNGVLYAKEFYPVDYPDSEQGSLDYRSTIFWDKLCLVSTKHDTTLSFFTSDVTGKFKIVIQGLLGRNKVYQEKEIYVNP